MGAIFTELMQQSQFNAARSAKAVSNVLRLSEQARTTKCITRLANTRGAVRRVDLNCFIQSPNEIAKGNLIA